MWNEIAGIYTNEVILVYKVSGKMGILLNFKPYITLFILELQMDLNFLIALQWN